MAIRNDTLSNHYVTIFASSFTQLLGLHLLLGLKLRERDTNTWNCLPGENRSAVAFTRHSIDPARMFKAAFKPIRERTFTEIAQC